MSKHVMEVSNNANEKFGKFLKRFQCRISAYPPGICPLTIQLSLLQTSRNQTCGKYIYLVEMVLGK